MPTRRRLGVALAVTSSVAVLAIAGVAYFLHAPHAPPVESLPVEPPAVVASPPPHERAPAPTPPVNPALLSPFAEPAAPRSHPAGKSRRARPPSPADPQPARPAKPEAKRGSDLERGDVVDPF